MKMRTAQLRLTTLHMWNNYINNCVKSLIYLILPLHGDYNGAPFSIVVKITFELH